MRDRYLFPAKHRLNAKKGDWQMRDNPTPNIGIILLAAGRSARLGQPKQLLDFRGSTLLQHSLQVALDASVRQVVLVLGANAAMLQNEVEAASAHLVVNQEWEEGIASSIRCGISAIAENDPATDGVVVMVCDQPFVTPEILKALIATHLQTGKQIVACGYDRTFGPPVFFHRSLFGALMELTGDTGAKKIVLQHAGETAVVPFPAGTIDIDTEADYKQLKANRP